MIERRWDLALLPCTARKNPQGITPLTLYRGSAFSLMMRHAQQRADRILIMSAKFGLLELDAQITWYDKYLPNLSPQEQIKLITQMESQINPQWAEMRVLSYLPKVYYSALLLAQPQIVATFHQPYKRLPSLILYKVLSNEIKNYGQNPSRR